MATLERVLLHLGPVQVVLAVTRETVHGRLNSVFLAQLSDGTIAGDMVPRRGLSLVQLESVNTSRGGANEGQERDEGGQHGGSSSWTFPLLSAFPF